MGLEFGVKVGNMARDNGLCVCVVKPHGVTDKPLGEAILQYASMVKPFKESHEKDVDRLAADRQCETESKEAHALKNAPKHTVVFMKGLTSPVWNLGMFQMVTGDSYQ